MTKTIVQVLEEAKALLVPRGAWSGATCQSGEHCAQTAMSFAAGMGTGLLKDTMRVFSEANGIPGHDMHVIWDWNDKPFRKKRQVLAAFDKALALARGREEVQSG